MNRMPFLLIVLSSLASCAAAASLFATSDLCADCHSSDSTTMIDSSGISLSVYHDWRSTMMANALLDPLFQAKVESEVHRNPHLQAVIEDKCTTCHAPMARTQAHYDGAEYYSMTDALASKIGPDAVSCTLCHQVQPSDLGSEHSFSGHYSVDDSRTMFGPYDDIFANPMVNATNYRPVFGEQVHQSRLCAACHTLFTPYVNDAGEVAGAFPEQTPYLEWLNSEYAAEGANHKSCQHCHMPPLDEQVKITRRPPWFTGTQSPFWRHHFVGSNTFVLALLRDNRTELGIPASVAQFDRTIDRTAAQIVASTAALEIVSVDRLPDKLAVGISVRNLTGHKLPTGFPARRMWIRLRASDASGKTLIDSGAWDAACELIGLDQGYEPHHDLITASDQIQVYEAVMGDVNGNVTYTLLRAAKYLKDNRLPPAGFRSGHPQYEHMAVCGAASDDRNFNRDPNAEGTAADTVTYEIPVTSAAWPLTISASLLFQNPAPRFVRDLPDGIAASDLFKSLYERAQNTPTLIAEASVDVPAASANFDSFGRVDFLDFALLADHWLSSDCDSCSEFDLHPDGIIDCRDLLAFVQQWLTW